MATSRRHNIRIEQGATWRLEVGWEDESGSPIDLTGWSARMQVREEHRGHAVVEWRWWQLVRWRWIVEWWRWFLQRRRRDVGRWRNLWRWVQQRQLVVKQLQQLDGVDDAIGQRFVEQWKRIGQWIGFRFRVEQLPPL